MKTTPQAHTTRHSAHTWLSLAAVLLMLSACGSSDINISESKNVQDAVDAATGPLEDLNIKKREIPELLKTAAVNPYARPKVLRCATVREEIAQFDALLGPDMKPKEVEVASADDGFMGISDVEMPTREQAADHVGGYAHSAVMSMISRKVNIIPFRSVVRTITGANRHSAKVAEAYEAGKLRRAYLKGFAAEHFGKKCLNLEPDFKKVTPLPEDLASNEVEPAETLSTPGSARRR